MPSQVKDLVYQAMEPQFNKIRLASDSSGNVYVITDDETPYSVPYTMAMFGELYRTTDEGMETYTLKEIEIQWLSRLKGMVSSLSAVPGADCD